MRMRSRFVQCLAQVGRGYACNGCDSVYVSFLASFANSVDVHIIIFDHTRLKTDQIWHKNNILVLISYAYYLESLMHYLIADFSHILARTDSVPCPAHEL